MKSVTTVERLCDLTLKRAAELQEAVDNDVAAGGPMQVDGERTSHVNRLALSWLTDRAIDETHGLLALARQEIEQAHLEFVAGPRLEMLDAIVRVRLADAISAVDLMEFTSLKGWPLPHADALKDLAEWFRVAAVPEIGRRRRRPRRGPGRGDRV